ncbi:site-specific integrase [Spirillospora sp. CA-255316]
MRAWIGSRRASIYRDGNSWTGVISLGRTPEGKRRRLKRRGPTEEVVLDKLAKAVEELDSGLTPGAAGYTVESAVNDMLQALAEQGRAKNTRGNLRRLADLHLIPQIGHLCIRDLTADDVEEWLLSRTQCLASSGMKALHGLLTRALRRAQRYGKVTQNVSAQVDTPRGRLGRPSRSMNLEQTCALLNEALDGDHRLGPYVVLSVLAGLRTEELRELTWDQVDLAAATVSVTRSDRVGGDTKTAKSRRALKISKLAVDALIRAKALQAADKRAAGAAYRDHGLVFCQEDGRPLAVRQVLYRFKRITDAAGLGTTWCPRELRHTFVSLLSDSEVPVEKIADLVGHTGTHTLMTVYRHQIRPVIENGAEKLEERFVGRINAVARRAPQPTASGAETTVHVGSRVRGRPLVIR